MKCPNAIKLIEDEIEYNEDELSELLLIRRLIIKSVIEEKEKHIKQLKAELEYLKGLNK